MSVRVRDVDRVALRTEEALGGARSGARVSAFPTLALRVEQAAEALNVPLEVFDEHVRPKIRLVAVGTLELVPVVELERLVAGPAEVERDAYSPAEAAARLGVSVDFFDEHVRPELDDVRCLGRKVIVPRRSLERWLDRSAALTLARRRSAAREVTPSTTRARANGLERGHQLVHLSG